MLCMGGSGDYILGLYAGRTYSHIIHQLLLGDHLPQQHRKVLEIKMMRNVALGRAPWGFGALGLWIQL